MHQSVIKVTWWNLKVISLHIPLHCNRGAYKGLLYTILEALLIINIPLHLKHSRLR